MAQKQAQKSGESIPALRVIAKREGFRRAGFEFGTAPKDIPLAYLKKDQIALLTEEPMLVCTEVEIEAE